MTVKGGGVDFGAVSEVRSGAIVKWDHATMAWWNLGFKSPWLH